MNDLFKYFNENTNGRQINKWLHYFEIYERYFSQFRGKPLVFLEIGIQNGGSYEMWRNYFGDQAQFYGIDIDPRCKNFEDEHFKVFIGSQKDIPFLNSVISEIPPIDIVLDDGGHTMEQQIVSFKTLFPHVRNTGIYMVEDTHTSYSRSHGGGLRRMGSFMEFAKKFADVVHGYHMNNKNSLIREYMNAVKSIHFHDSLVVFEKDKVEKPQSQISGKVTIPYDYPIKKRGLKERLIGMLNILLQLARLPSTRIDDDRSR